MKNHNWKKGTSIHLLIYKSGRERGEREVKFSSYLFYYLLWFSLYLSQKLHFSCVARNFVNNVVFTCQKKGEREKKTKRKQKNKKTLKKRLKIHQTRKEKLKKNYQLSVVAWLNNRLHFTGFFFYFASNKEEEIFVVCLLVCI